MRQSLVLLLLLVALPAVAQIYKYTDANGNTAYSNQPPDGTKTETVNLPPLNSVNTSPAPIAPAAPTPRQNPQSPGQSTAAYETLQLTDIPSDEALRANNGTFSVGVRIQPRLQTGHTLQLILDGAPYGQPANVPRLQFTELDRGEHSIAVQVLQDQRSIQQSQPVNITVQRVHVGRP
jgi:hypothetical protein